jgi:hypothetical protein
MEILPRGTWLIPWCLWALQDRDPFQIDNIFILFQSQ